MVKVLFLAYYFPPMGGAGVQRAQKFVRYLPAYGYLPVVLTGPGAVKGRWTPSDATLISAISSEVPVYRVQGPVPEPAGGLQRRLNTWFALPTTFGKWWIDSAMQAAKHVSDKPELILATMSPFESGEAAYRISKSLGIPWVADLRDPWALDEMQIYPTLLHRRYEMKKMERILSTAALIIMNTPEATAVAKATFSALRATKIVTITNGFDAEDFSERVADRNDSKFRVVHSGYLHTADGLRLQGQRFRRLLGGAASGVEIVTRSHAVLVEAIDRWLDRSPKVADDLEVVLAGENSPEDRALADTRPSGSLLRFTGYLPHSESLSLIRTADLLFLPMHNLPVGRRSRIVPGKTYEYMAAERPILAAVPDGDARDFLRQCGTAFICRPDDVAGMVEILDQAYSAWKNKVPTQRSNYAFVSQFTRRNLAGTLAGALDGLLSSRDAYRPASLALGLSSKATS